MQGDRNEKQKDAQGSAEFENSYRVRQLGYRVWRVGCGPVKKILATQLHTSQSMILWWTIQQILYQEILLQTNSKNLYLNIRNTMLLYFFLVEYNAPLQQRNFRFTLHQLARLSTQGRQAVDLPLPFVENSRWPKWAWITLLTDLDQRCESYDNKKYPL